jgi:hypothetical protein
VFFTLHLMIIANSWHNNSHASSLNLNDVLFGIKLERDREECGWMKGWRLTQERIIDRLKRLLADVVMQEIIGKKWSRLS